MLRFDIELQLLEGSLSVRDLPGAWQARYQADLGLNSPDDKDGVLQDMHWFAGQVGGAFQGYTLGNILGPLFLETALARCPEIGDDFRRGQFSSLHAWL
jgi:carboxypeptidase Taq